MFYQLRRYVPAEGKSSALHARFRNHVLGLMKESGVEVVGFFEEPSGNITYLVRFEDQQAAVASWKRFNESPEWKAVKSASETDGPLTARIESYDLNPVPYFEGILQ